MESKNTMLLTVIAIATLLVAVVGATFAYFTSTQIDSGRSVLTVQTHSVDQITANGTNVTLTVNQEDMLKENAKNDYSAHTPDPEVIGDVSISTTLGSAGGVNTCTFDLIYTPTVIYVKSEDNTSNLKEFVVIVEGSATDGVLQGGEQAEIDLTGANSITQLATGVKLIVTGEEDKTGTATFTIIPRYYNLDLNQSENQGKTFGGNVTITNLECVNTPITP